MKKRINNKGFTLIELLVAMTILSIITAMAIPILRNVTNSGSKKYETFQDNVIYASKLFVDSYAEDLFDNRESGCAYIDIEQLVDRKLAKDINIDNTSCINEESYVQVVKTGSTYTYTPYITCGTINDDGSVGTNGYTYPEGKHVKDETSCGFESDFQMTVDVSVEQTNTSARKTGINVIVNSYTGINPNVQMYYGFTTDADSQTSDYTWQRVSFNIPTVNEQKRTLASGSSPSGIKITSSEIYTPDNYDGSLYLILRIDSMLDLYGESWSRAAQGNRYLKYGPYKLDNSTPVIGPMSLTKENGAWKYEATITDETNYEGYIGLCPTAREFGTSCVTKDDFSMNYNSSKVVTQYVSVNSRGWGEFCMKAMDSAGNTSAASCSKKTTYKVKMNYNDGSGGYETRSVVFDDYRDNKYYSEIVTAGPNKTRSGYKFKNWSTSISSKGIVDGTTLFKGEVNQLYAIWQLRDYTITLKNIDNFGKSSTLTYNIETAKTLDNLDSVPGYTFTGWTSSTMTTPKRSYTVPKGTTGNLEFYANFSANSYKITLTNLETSNQTINYTTNDTVTIPNPTKSGYTFTGWTGSGYSTPTKNLTLPKYSYGNKSFTANWTRN